eukprot:CAMPEP_0201594404 /NCGR_PEP_ID=MMETSP0190_2-20130828/191735_1 /ASSEMBLY_ACC=CAM_ASM_000263 /TAXON_ID=37353 /ORGANISM="Rosalina sp." /LENGTH=306 /DNA_ID=CAMNT_0048054009 /DNA_START=13 /DNA_END=930 /DNA_ORIENTATION=-
MTEAIEYDREIKQIFNSTAYYVRASTTTTTLHVEVEQIDNGHKWKNRFVKSHIEEMTSKTGNYISFDRFCEMMNSALQRNNDGSVYIDLLTWQDLEILKARKAAHKGQEPSQQLNATHRTKNKRYIILTYVAEYDRVHYPLCLKLDDNSTLSKVDRIKKKSNPKSRPNNKNNTNINNKRCAMNNPKSRPTNINNKRCAMKTARQLLAHSIASSSSSSSSSSSQSSLTSSPQSSFNHPQQIRNPKAIQYESQQSQNSQNNKKHYRSTPNLNEDENVNNQRHRQSMTSYQSPKNKAVNNINAEKLSAL